MLPTKRRLADLFHIPDEHHHFVLFAVNPMDMIRMHRRKLLHGHAMPHPEQIVILIYKVTEEKACVLNQQWQPPPRLLVVQWSGTIYDTPSGPPSQWQRQYVMMPMASWSPKPLCYFLLFLLLKGETYAAWLALTKARSLRSGLLTGIPALNLLRSFTEISQMSNRK